MAHQTAVQLKPHQSMPSPPPATNTSLAAGQEVGVQQNEGLYLKSVPNNNKPCKLNSFLIALCRF